MNNSLPDNPQTLSKIHLPHNSVTDRNNSSSTTSKPANRKQNFYYNFIILQLKLTQQYQCNCGADERIVHHSSLKVLPYAYKAFYLSVALEIKSYDHLNYVCTYD